MQLSGAQPYPPNDPAGELGPNDPDLIAATELLNTELPADRFVDSSYLHHLYRTGPFGIGFEGNIYGDDGVLNCHYGLIPQEFRTSDGPVPALFSLNAAIRSTSQKQGNFTKLASALYGPAIERGIRVGTAVTNANSTTAAVKYLGWRLLGPMPVKLIVPRPGRARSGVEHRAVTRQWLDSPDFAALAGGLDDHPVTGYTIRYTPEYLRWRLGWPNCPYHLHYSDELVAVTARTVQNRVPATAILKLLPRNGAVGPLDPRSLLNAIIRYHRVGFAVYAGWNDLVPVSGVAPPRKLLPSPLNSLVRSFTPEIDNDDINLDAFEFLDMDAY